MAETRPMPPVGDLIALIQASLRNAVGLVEDARLLLSSGRASRAHALATLALEEVGKSCLCMLALVPTPASMTLYGLKSGEDFWAAWREHTDKLMWALGVLDLLIRDSGSATQAFERIRAAASDGHPRVPPVLQQSVAAGLPSRPNERGRSSVELEAKIDADGILQLRQLWRA